MQSGGGGGPSGWFGVAPYSVARGYDAISPTAVRQAARHQLELSNRLAIAAPTKLVRKSPTLPSQASVSDMPVLEATTSPPPPPPLQAPKKLRKHAKRTQAEPRLAAALVGPGLGDAPPLAVDTTEHPAAPEAHSTGDSPVNAGHLMGTKNVHVVQTQPVQPPGAPDGTMMSGNVSPSHAKPAVPATQPLPTALDVRDTWMDPVELGKRLYRQAIAESPGPAPYNWPQDEAALEQGMSLPQTRIPSRFHVRSVQPICAAFATGGAVTMDEDGYSSLVFPSAKPGTRQDAVHLQIALDTMMAELAGARTAPLPGPAVPGLGFTGHVAAELRILHLVLCELVRQVYFHCEERGVLLDRVRVRLFDILSASDSWCHQFATQSVERRDRVEQLEALVHDLRTELSSLTSSSHTMKRQLTQSLLTHARARTEAEAAAAAYDARARAAEMGLRAAMSNRHLMQSVGVGEERNSDHATVWDAYAAGNRVQHRGVNVSAHEIRTAVAARGLYGDLSNLAGDFWRPGVEDAGVSTERQDMLEAMRRWYGAGHWLVQAAESGALWGWSAPGSMLFHPNRPPSTDTRLAWLRSVTELCEQIALQQGDVAAAEKFQVFLRGRPLTPPVTRADRSTSMTDWDPDNDDEESDAEEETATERTKKATKPFPPEWKALKLNVKEARVMPERTLVLSLLQILQEKIKADEVDLRQGTPIATMANFVVNYMMFKFGTKPLVQGRLASLVATLRQLKPPPAVATLFCRFAGLVRGCTLNMMTITLRFMEDASRNTFANWNTNVLAKDMIVRAAGQDVLAAMKTVATHVPGVLVVKMESQIRAACRDEARARSTRILLPAPAGSSKKLLSPKAGGFKSAETTAAGALVWLQLQVNKRATETAALNAAWAVLDRNVTAATDLRTALHVLQEAVSTAIRTWGGNDVPPSVHAAAGNWAARQVMGAVLMPGPALQAALREACKAGLSFAMAKVNLSPNDAAIRIQAAFRMLLAKRSMAMIRQQMANTLREKIDIVQAALWCLDMLQAALEVPSAARVLRNADEGADGPDLQTDLSQLAGREFGKSDRYLARK